MKYIQKFEARKSTEQPFIQSAKRGSRTAIENFIKQGVDINMRGQHNRTALMNAALNSNLMIVDILIKNGADVNLQDKDGRTALMMASTPKIIQHFLDCEDLNINIRNYNGDTVAMEWLNYMVKNELKYLQKFIEKGLDLDIKNNSGNNFYDIISENLLNPNFIRNSKYDSYYEIQKYLDDNFPKYKEMWQLRRDISKFNL